MCTHRPDARVLVPELCWMFCWLSGNRLDTPASSLVRALSGKPYVSALLMLATELTTRVGPRIRERKMARLSGVRTNNCDTSAMRSGSLAVFTADDARMTIMRYLDKELPPL